MKLDHTPGPWKYEKGDEDSGYGGRHFVSHPETQCDVTTICETNYGEHDARLIAAAPEMLKALISLVEYQRLDKELIKNPIITIIESATGKTIEEVLS